MRKATRIPLLALLAVGLAACISGGEKVDPESPQLMQMRVKLNNVCTNLNRATQVATEKMARATDDSEIKFRLVLAKIYTHTACRRALIHPNPYVAFLDIWVLLVQRRRLIEERGHELFGDQIGIAAEANREVLAYVERIAATVIRPQLLAETKAEIEKFAAENPISDYMREWGSDSGEAVRGESILKSVTKLAPTLGIKKTAASIRDVAHSIDAVSNIVSDLPLLARWNATLLLYEFSADPTMLTMRNSAASIATTADRLATLADEYPARLQAEVSKTLDEIDTKQEGVRQTLDDAKAVATEAKDAVAELRATVKEAETTIASAEAAAGNFARAGEAWQPVFGDLLKITGPARPDPGPPGPDPDIENLVRLSQEARGAATELAAALKDARGMLEGEDIDRIGGTATGTVDHATERLAGLVDHITWRAVQLVLVIAVVALAYRLLALRFRRPPAA